MGLRYLLQTKGLADVLLRRHSASIDAELSTQDLESFTALDTELREENMNVSLNVMTFTSYWGQGHSKSGGLWRWGMPIHQKLFFYFIQNELDKFLYKEGGYSK